ncbi:MAG: hypothetical protein DRQ63_01515 [Gammaproteobacteria bacterium]|nr:MAG: hypothetical protein DRQ63_01515 [Gammaproteobacteria bacterium]
MRKRHEEWRAKHTAEQVVGITINLCGPYDMNDSADRHVPWLLWPFYAVWRLLTFILGIIGRLLSALLGILLMTAGVSVALTVVGAPFGVPLAALGFLLLVRALF